MDVSLKLSVLGRTGQQESLLLIHSHPSLFYVVIHFIAYVFEQKDAGFTHGSCVHPSRDPVYSLAREARWELVLSCSFTAVPGPSRAVPFPAASLYALEAHCALPPDIHDQPLAILVSSAGMSPGSQEIPFWFCAMPNFPSGDLKFSFQSLNENIISATPRALLVFSFWRRRKRVDHRSGVSPPSLSP